MIPYSQSVPQRLRASGGSAPISLLELQTVAGFRYNWATANISAPSIIDAAGVPGAGGVVTFDLWLVGDPMFHSYKSTQTTTGSASIQNLTGDTIRRDVSMIFTQQEFIGAMFAYRYWLTDCETALQTYQGTVDDADVDADGESMTLTFESITNWATISAPDKQIGVSCPVTFGSIACGSTSDIPCNNNYGTCSSTERFMGVVQEWVGSSLDYTQYVQPEPLRLYNGRIKG